jgi:hypothetical protein
MQKVADDVPGENDSNQLKIMKRPMSYFIYKFRLKKVIVNEIL